LILSFDKGRFKLFAIAYTIAAKTYTIYMHETNFQKVKKVQRGKFIVSASQIKTLNRYNSYYIPCQIV